MACAEGRSTVSCSRPLSASTGGLPAAQRASAALVHHDGGLAEFLAHPEMAGTAYRSAVNEAEPLGNNSVDGASAVGQRKAREDRDRHAGPAELIVAHDAIQAALAERRGSRCEATRRLDAADGQGRTPVSGRPSRSSFTTDRTKAQQELTARNPEGSFEALMQGETLHQLDASVSSPVCVLPIPPPESASARHGGAFRGGLQQQILQQQGLTAAASLLTPKPGRHAPSKGRRHALFEGSVRGRAPCSFAEPAASETRGKAMPPNRGSVRAWSGQAQGHSPSSLSSPSPSNSYSKFSEPEMDLDVDYRRESRRCEVRSGRNMQSAASRSPAGRRRRPGQPMTTTVELAVSRRRDRCVSQSPGRGRNAASRRRGSDSRARFGSGPRGSTALAPCPSELSIAHTERQTSAGLVLGQSLTHESPCATCRHPERYCGEVDYNLFRKQFLERAKVMRWNSTTMAKQLVQLLSGEALGILRHLAPHQLGNFAVVDSALRRRFGIEVDVYAQRAQLRNLQRKGDQSLETYAAEIEHVVRGAYPTLLEHQLQQQMVCYFIEGLNDPIMALLLVREKHQNLDAVLASARVRPPSIPGRATRQSAVNVATVRRPGGNERGGVELAPGQNGCMADAFKAMAESPRTQPKRQERLLVRTQLGLESQGNPSSGTTGSGARNRKAKPLRSEYRVCFYCRVKGHLIRHCRVRKAREARAGYN